MKKEVKKEIKKQAKPKEVIPVKEYFTVQVEALAPVVLTYKVYAESPEQALEMVLKPGATLSKPPNLNLLRLKRLKATVYTAGSVMIRFVKNLA